VPVLTLTFLGYSAFKFDLPGLRIYVDPFFRDPIDWTRLEEGDVVLYTHGHFDHGVSYAPALYEAWRCKFVAPRNLIRWMGRHYRKQIPASALVPLSHGESVSFRGIEVTAVYAEHPVNRLGKTILALLSRSRAPGTPVNGYYFAGYYHSGDTIYTPRIATALKDYSVDVACLPIGGKYKVAGPQEALTIAEEIGAKHLIPMHWQPLTQQVPFRYRPSDILRLAEQTETAVEVHALAIGEVFDAHQKSLASTASKH
jgi:L-ascorbate metabolism protein UlaG (beta-lactamase superfamily)